MGGETIMYPQGVSVVIPVRSDRLLERALASIPTKEDVEVVVALTRASAEVARIAEAARACNQRIKIVQTNRVGMAVGVNLGTRAATHENVVLLDSDCRLDDGALDAFRHALNLSAFVRGRTLVDHGCGWSTFARLGTEAMNTRFAAQARLMGPSIGFRKSAFFALGGYDEAMAGSCDHEFTLRMEDAGISTAYAHDAIVHHQPITFRIDTRSHFSYGRGMRYIDTKRGGYYGLRVCIERFYPSVLWAKLRTRGALSVPRSILLGFLMVFGYIQEGAARRALAQSARGARR